MKLKGLLILSVFALILSLNTAPTIQAVGASADSGSSVPLQPFMDQVQRLQAALNFAGQPLTNLDQEQIKSAFASQNAEAAVSKTESVLDKYVLAVVTINAESRVDVKRGNAPPDLMQDGTRLFLVKVVNQAGVTAPLGVESPNSGPVYVRSSNSAEPAQRLTLADVRERWADISLFNQPPMSDEHLLGLPLEYRILVISSRDAGQRAARLSFNVGQGTRDVGFLNEVSILFKIAPTHSIALHVIDGDASADSGSSVPLQPFMDQVQRLQAALNFAGQPLTNLDQEQIKSAFASQNAEAAVSKTESVLDKYVLAVVTINAESRVDVKRGNAPPDLMQDGTRLFLVKVVNQAGVTAPLGVESPNSGPVYVRSSNSAEPAQRLTLADVRERWADISLFNQPPMSDEHLLGLPLEYRILVISSRDAGQRAARLSFNVGQGTRDVGFLNEVSILFKIAPTHSIALHVIDGDGKPTMASFIFRDNMGRIYPNPIKRLAPDFYFQPQVYRSDGESIQLPPGLYTVTYTGGPEYVPETRKFTVTGNAPTGLTFHLDRWIDPAKYGWYSGDDHIHPAGCSHYENPTEGVDPKAMDRQVLGEHLNVGAVLVWGPCFYYQSHFFRGRQDNPISTSHSLLHYDLEVSGFPSSHAGHLVLLNLKHIMYPGTKRIEEWPTWDLPVLRWAKSQGAAAGFAHSGLGLAVGTKDLPNYIVPGFDGIGANEYIVDVTYPNTVDFISLGDTPYVWELNIWYQTLNVGFRTRISGETDFPCIYDTRVGEGRTYAKIHGPLTYDNYVKAVQDGAVYVSDGRSHLMDFAINSTEMGTHDSQVDLSSPSSVNVAVTAVAYLPTKPTNAAIKKLPYDEKPFWDLERSRIGITRKVPVEVVMNGEAVARKEIVADGSLQKLNFSVPVIKSSWIAVRILPSSHTNPIFVIVAGKQIRASRRSAKWCLRSVNQCWTQKAPKISSREMPEAMKAYDHARAVYRKLISESSDE